MRGAVYIPKNPVNNDLYREFVSWRKDAPDTKTAGQNLPSENKNKNKKFNYPVLAATAAGTLASVLIIKKYQPVNKTVFKNTATGILKNIISVKNSIVKFLDIKIGLKEMFLLGFGSIAGGLSGGIASEEKPNIKNKVKESIYQFCNMAVPASIAIGLTKLITKHKKLNNNYGHTAASVIGIGGGMAVASWLCNKFNNNFIDKGSNDKRHMKLKDCIMNTDDLVMASVVSKPALASKLSLNKIMPILFLTCGYEAGNKK